MKRITVLPLLLALILLTAPAIGSHNRHDHSRNVEQVSTTRLQWRESTQDTNALVSPVYVADFAFQEDLVAGGVAGAHAPARPAGDVPESGLAVFGLRQGGNVARQLGRLHCKTTSDVSLWGNLAFQGSLESQQTSTTNQPSDPCDRDGLRIIDISARSRPKQTAFVEVPCGVGEHALVPAGRALYLYNPSSCNETVDNPWGAGITSEMSVLRINRRYPKRSHISSVADISPMTGCSEVAVILTRDLGVCSGDRRFMLFDISDPPNPKPLLDAPVVLEYDIRSVTFSWDGSLLAIGTASRVHPQPGFQLFDIEDVSNPVPVSEWIPPETDALDSQPYSLAFVPMRNRREVVVAAMGALGMRIVDVTDPASPREIGHYSAYDAATATVDNPYGNSNTIAAYWYNGRFYVSDFDRLRVFKMKGFNRRTVYYFKRRFNPQTQTNALVDG